MGRKFRMTEVAAQYAVSVRQVARWIADGLPVIRIGRRGIRLDLDDVAAWLEERSARSEASQGARRRGRPRKGLTNDGV